MKGNKMLIFFVSIWQWLFDNSQETSEDVEGSHCGCCGKWLEGDQGDSSYPVDWRWTVCPECSSN